MIVLGLNFEHDAGAALMQDGRLLAVVEAERVTGRKHASGLTATRAAITAVLAQAGVLAREVDAVAFPDLSAGEIFTPHLDRRPEIQLRTHAGPMAWCLGSLGDVGFDAILGRDVASCRSDIPVFVTCHSMTHAAGAVYMAGASETLGLVIDGYGTCCGTMGYEYRAHVLSRRESIQDRVLLGTGYHGIGILAREIVQTSALDVAGKVMGLHAYGRPRPNWVDYFRQRYFASSAETGYADYLRQSVRFRGASSPERLCAELFPGGLAAGSLSVDDPVYRDLVASMQEAFTAIVCDLADEVADGAAQARLFLSGGCALNIVANAAVARRPWVSTLFVPPNASDCGLAMGAAVLGMHAMTLQPLHRPEVDTQVRRNPYVGASLQDEPSLAEAPPDITTLRFDWDDREHRSALAQRLIAGEIVGVMHGPSEIGPRALGNRSILALASRPGMKNLINHKIKRREWWRPFAPVCRRLDADLYFEHVVGDRYMTMHATVREDYRQRLASVTHVDHSCRLQTLASREDHPRLWDLLTDLARHGAVPVVINTSFNLSRRPIANTTAEALELLTGSQLDAVIVEDHLFTKTAAGRLQREREAIAPYFDASFYEARYRTARPGGLPALEHYLAGGWRRGHDPNAWFCTRRYLERYPEVTAAGANPLWDFVVFGWRAGRHAEPPEGVTGPEIHVPRLLLNRGLDADEAAVLAVAARLDPAFYHTQLREQGVGVDAASCARHYLRAGGAQGIDPAPWFSGVDYLRDYEDIVAAGLPPFLHYVQQGESEGRRVFSSRAATFGR